MLPQTAIVPVGSTGGKHGLVGPEGLEIVNAAAGALKALAIGRATNIGIEGGNGVLKQGRLGGVGLFFGYLVAWTFVEAARCKQQAN